ncbi:hypothetical protein D3C78_1248130 [compost metagenome]
MSPLFTLRVVTGLCAPSVLMPDWNQVQVSISSTSSKVSAMARTMAWVACRATSYSGTWSRRASTTAAPPMSAMRAPWRIITCSSADLIMRMRMHCAATSTSSASG